MIPLNSALIYALNTLGEHPDIEIVDLNDKTYDVTLTWPQQSSMGFNVTIGDAVGTSLIDVFERDNVTYAWKEYFTMLLYGYLEEVNPAAYYTPQ